jgi:Asp-tRNA(Asn)/Glu-tRNA(Gln) amidotransferase A subunit family amidase
MPVDSVPTETDPSVLRFGVVKQWLSPPHTTQVAEGVDQFLANATALGIDIVEVDEPGLIEDPSAAAAFGPEVMAVHGKRFAATPEGYGPQTRIRIRDAAQGTAEDLMAAMTWRSAARAIVVWLFASGIDALIAPTVGGMRKMIGDQDMDLDGQSVFHRKLLASFTAPINQIGAPSIAAPVAGTGGPPVSVQLIGPRWGESVLLGVAAALETAGVLGVLPPPVFFK